MIIARGQIENLEMLLLGLSRENVQRLTQGNPIYLTRKTHGDGIPDGWQIVIIYGETERAMSATLKAVGLVTKDTPIHGHPNL